MKKFFGVALIVATVLMAVFTLVGCATTPKGPISNEYVGFYSGNIIHPITNMEVFTWTAEAKQNGEFIFTVNKATATGTIDSNGKFYVKPKGILQPKYKGTIDKNTKKVEGKMIGGFGVTAGKIQGKKIR